MSGRDERPAERDGDARAALDIAEDFSGLAHGSGLRRSIHTVAREGLADHEPAAYALMNHMRLDADQVAEVEISINDAANPEAGVRDWLEEKKNRELVRPWVEAAKRAQEEAQ